MDDELSVEELEEIRHWTETHERRNGLFPTDAWIEESLTRLLHTHLSLVEEFEDTRQAHYEFLSEVVATKDVVKCAKKLVAEHHPQDFTELRTALKSLAEHKRKARKATKG
jgi:23S rRNA A2030 N6-methylase RlmJ